MAEQTKVKPVGVKLPGDFSVKAHGHELTGEHLASMSPEAIAYLLRVGFTGSVTDAAAMSKEKKASYTDLKGEIETRRAKRFDEILKGEVSHGGSTGARATPLERFVQDVALEKVKAMSASRGAPMPKKESLKIAIEKLLQHPEIGADIRATAEKRLAEANSNLDAIADLFTVAE